MKQTIAIHILSNMWRSKENHTINYGKLIEYNMKNIFLGKSYPECDGETAPRPWSEKLNISGLIV